MLSIGELRESLQSLSVESSRAHKDPATKLAWHYKAVPFCMHSTLVHAINVE